MLRTQSMVSRLRWIADGYDRYNHRQAFELNLLWKSSTTITALLTEAPELYAFMRFRSGSLTEFYEQIYQAIEEIEAVRCHRDGRRTVKTS